MSTIDQSEEWVRNLAALPRREYVELIREVDAKRRKAVEDEGAGGEPEPGIDRDGFARWIGRQHHLIDSGISQVFYLPHDAPADEIRLLEVNELASLPEAGPISAVDFMPDIKGVNYRLLVADVTPRQMGDLRRGALALPPGWSLTRMEQVAPARG